jgi:oxygen-dependent protoporphyrinogen oxidase
VSIVAERGRCRVDDEQFDAVVIASPAPAAATLLASVEPAASRHLAEFEQADVIIARLVLDAGSLATDVLAGHSGYLVPKSRQRLVTAVSFASEKWAHWRLPSGDPVLRVSLGRDRLPVSDLDDDAVIDAIDHELSSHLGVALAIKEISITRWPDAFPQYRPHHSTRVTAIEAALPSSIALAGASYRGIGIPACIADGRRAAAAVGAALATEPSSSAKPQLPQ